MCGQQNDDKNVSFKDLSRDLVENFFSFDSRLAHSIVPFFFKPGFLTTEYNEGKRYSYANPIRLYIIVSVFYFFILSIIVGDASRKLDSELQTVEADSLQTVLLHEFDSTEFKIDAVNADIRSENLEDGSGFWPLSGAQWNVFIDLTKNKQIKDKAFFDSLHVEGRHEFTQFVVKQMIRVVRKDKEYLTSVIVKNLSLMMFLMIPIFAFLLKLIYFRRKILYINHLIHTIHIHTFAFFVYGLAMALLYWYVEGDNMEGWVTFISIVLVSTYAYISFLKVYQQKWKKTLLKFWLTGFFYSIFIFMALLIEISISFLIF
jgi:hypothetical protein